METTDPHLIPSSPTRAMAEKAREIAEQFAAERGVSIEQVCVAMSPTGESHAFVVAEDEEEDGDE